MTPKEIAKEADLLVTALGKRWGKEGVAGVFLMVAVEEDSDDEHFKAEMINVAGGSPRFKLSLPKMLMQSGAEMMGRLMGFSESETHACEEGREKPKVAPAKNGEFPNFLADLLRKSEPGANE